MHEPIIIVGAGAAGLMAARELSAAGLPTLVLEATGHPGGRAHTLPAGDFSFPVEAGAEFIHGHLPLTLELLKEAGIRHHPVKGEMLRVRKGEWLEGEIFTEGWDTLMGKMHALQEDLSVMDFLHTWFAGDRYAGLRDLVRRYAEGYDLVDMEKASTKALYREWQEEGEEQYRIEGGYSRLAQWMVRDCEARGAVFHFSCPVEEVAWERGRVRVAAGGQVFTGSKVIVTVPVSILREDLAAHQEALASDAVTGPLKGARGILFTPAIPDYRQAAARLGYGTVTKVLLEFREAFWNKQQENIGFILSDEAIPTWWTQCPDKTPLLTGWLAGTALKALQGLTEEELVDRSLSSLASIFSIKAALLKEQLVAARILDWSGAPFIRGGYSYDTVESAEARKLLRRPLEDTLFFGGEALHEGRSPGTVEAAFTNGKEIAETIIARS